MITIEKLSLKRGTQQVLKDVSCQIFAGEVVVLCGQSGSGKSTLLNVLNGLIPELYPAEMTGVVQVAGDSLPTEDFPAYARKIGVVFQNPKTQFFTTDVYSELAFTMENAGVEPVEIRKRIKEVAEQFSLSELLDASVFELSGGEKQRVAIACATMLSHTPQQIHNLGLRRINEPQFELAINETEGASISADLIATNLQVTYRRQQQPALDIAKLVVPTRQVVGLIGPNGAGKSTLFQVFAGLKKCSAAQFWLHGQPINQKQLLRENFLVMQDVNLQLFFESVEKELLAKAARPERFEQVVTLLELEHLLRRHPQSLSGGEKQRVAIGSALLSGKRLLFFDEPTSGLDLQQMEEVGNLLQEVAKEVDLLAVISHDKEFLDETCPYVIQLEQGKLVDTYQLATNGG
ncbi:ABC transporter ATP-binding protein [Enterococcus gallinarum]|uniref:ATP-binding cassette domain-containing protein n=1 Tax=Enterococcus gallinarum TaxID=1353 RepID=UPI00214B1D35|nr:ABC transporter ATP-binding protein [Enterococcus gallinarum]MCR1928247.1 ABC transporter ATP-binding protein [Enterococcus gallinarum]